jgi:hypothetical protein
MGPIAHMSGLFTDPPLEQIAHGNADRRLSL